MNKVLLTNILIMASLLSLAGCGGGTSTAKLEVSKSFAIGNSFFSGGLVIHGENNLGNSFSVALDSNLEKTVNLANGTWKFHAIGWAGPEKFEGTTQCGSTSVNVQGNVTVDLKLDSTACSSSAFLSDVNLKSTKTQTCGVYYTYDSATDTYSPLNSAVPLNFCSALPLQYQSQMQFYDVIALENLNGALAPRFRSKCKSLGTEALSLPVKKIPLTIRTYKTNTDCLAANSSGKTFRFPLGIEKGNRENFEHKLFADTGKLLLPSSVSRRGTSPFMTSNMLPRILCGTPGALVDCIGDIDTAGVQVFVPWMNGTQHNQLIFKNTTANTCPADLLNNSDLFSASSCGIHDGNMYAQVKRNELNCQTPNAFADVIDIYTTSDKVYILKNLKVEVYTHQGEYLFHIPISGTPTGIAADQNYIYVGDNTNQNVIKFDSTSASSPVSISIPDLQDFDVTENGSFLVASTATGNIKTYDTSTTFFINSKAFSPARISATSSVVFALDPLNDKIQRFVINSSGYLTQDSFVTVSTDTVDIAKSPMAPHMFYTLDSASGQMVTYDSLGNNPIVMTTYPGNKIALLPSGKYLIATGTGLQTSNTQLGLCQEAVAINLNGVTKTLNIKSKEASPYQAYADAIKFLGRRNLTQYENASYIFPDLRADEDEKDGGGIINLLQDDLSGAGVTGLLGQDFPTCESLKTKVSDGSVVSFNRTIPLRGDLIGVSINVSKNSSLIPDFICEDNNPNPTSCTRSYDLKVQFAISGPDWNENAKILLKCGSKLGSYEISEKDNDGRSRKEIYVWNTNDHVVGRYEQYSINDEPDGKTHASIVMLQKSAANDLLVREVSFHTESGSVSGGVTELQFEAGNKMMSHKNYQHESDLSTFFSEYSAIASGATLSGSDTQACTDPSTGMIFITNSACALTGATLPQTSRGLDLKLETFNSNGQTIMRSIFDQNL